MALNTEYDIVKAFEAIENELIASMIRNMKDHKLDEIDEDKQWAMWQAEQLKALEKYRRSNQKKFGAEFEKINADIEALIRVAREEGEMNQEIAILKAIKNGFKGKKVSSGMSAEFFRLNERKLEALIDSVNNDMQKAETAVLRMANDQYRKIIYNAQVYANTGAGTYEKAVDMATKDFLAAGLNCVEYSNGARHTLKDYADMAIRTASKRAYLQGEGTKRQEWGISTVIVNKRGNPCPKCLPFCGKVLIDDVWSGGSKKDGKYPLMSYAIQCGYLHPRCKDSHTTYFPGISTADDTWTKKELEDIGLLAKTEAKQQYAKRQAEKFERLEKYSLDKENKRIYQSRAEQWQNEANRLEFAKSSYVPAKTIEEAQEFAKNYCQNNFMDKTFKGMADFKGISLENANDINKALAEVYDNYDIPQISGIKAISATSAKGKKVFKDVDAVMAYSPIEHGVYINKDVLKNKESLKVYNKKSSDAWDTVMDNIDSLKGSQKEIALRYKEAGRSLVGDGSAKDYFIHELGHHVQWKGFDAKTNNLIGSNMSKYSGKISGYATASKSEYFAESFSAYMKGERKILDPEFASFLDKKSLVNSGGSGIINTEIDELTPCLRRIRDNRIVDTGVFKISPTKEEFSDWEFDWTIPEKKGYSVYEVKAEGDYRTQGMVALKKDKSNYAVHVDIVESAPFNNPHNKKFIKKEYSGVGGHLFAEAVKQSYEAGFDGVVYFTAKTDLIEHYTKELGASLINPRQRIMMINENAAKKLYERYYGGKK